MYWWPKVYSNKKIHFSTGAHTHIHAYIDALVTAQAVFCISLANHVHAIRIAFTLFSTYSATHNWKIQCFHPCIALLYCCACNGNAWLFIRTRLWIRQKWDRKTKRIFLSINVLCVYNCEHDEQRTGNVTVHHNLIYILYSSFVYGLSLNNILCIYQPEALEGVYCNEIQFIMERRANLFFIHQYICAGMCYWFARIHNYVYAVHNNFIRAHIHRHSAHLFDIY